MDEKKLKTKDLVNIGIFSAIYMVLSILVMVTAIFSPILWLLWPAITGIICNFIYMLLVSKVPKPRTAFLLITITGIIYFDKPRGAGWRAVIRGCPNGGTRHLLWGVTCIWIDRVWGGYAGKWNILVPVGEDIPWVMASESGWWLNRCRVVTRQGLRRRSCWDASVLISAGVGRVYGWVAEPSGMAGRSG